MIMILKMLQPKKFDDVRGISLLSVLSKWYVMGLMIIIHDVVAKMSCARWKRFMTFGFEEYYDTEQISVGLSVLIQKEMEGHHQLPVCIISTDVRAAFDNLGLGPDHSGHAILGISCLIAALVEESIGLHCTASIQCRDALTFSVYALGKAR